MSDNGFSGLKALLAILQQIIAPIIDKLKAQHFVFIIVYIIVIAVAGFLNPQLITDFFPFLFFLAVLALGFDLGRFYLEIRMNQAGSPPFIESSTTKEIEGKEEEKGKEEDDGEYDESEQPLEPENELLKTIHNECRFVALGGIDPKASDLRQQSVELRAVYTDLLTTEFDRDKNGDPITGLFKEPIVRSALGVLEHNSRLVLLGEPGSGKTTLVNFLSLCLSGERLYRDGVWASLLRSDDATWSHGPLLPLRMQLRDLIDRDVFNDSDEKGEKRHLWQLITMSLTATGGKDFIQKLPDYLHRGDMILFLDGLDEIVTPQSRRLITEAIIDFSVEYPRCRYVVTCRQAAYPRTRIEALQMPWFLDGFHVSMLDSFDDKRIISFIDSWFKELSRIGHFSEKIGQNKAKHLQEAIGYQPGLHRIAGKPLLLTVMAILHDHYGELPETQVALYQRCTELLLWRWEMVKYGRRAGQEFHEPDILKDLGLQRLIRREDIERALYQAVFKAHNGQRNGEGAADIRADTIIEELQEVFRSVDLSPNDAAEKATRFVQFYLRERAGLFVEKQDYVFTTLHRSFQEYLAARYLCSTRNFAEQVAELVESRYEQWREVFLMAIGQMCLDNHISQAIDAVNRLYPGRQDLNPQESNLIALTGEALSEIGLSAVRQDGVGKRLLQSIRNDYMTLLHADFLPPVRRAYIGSLLGELGDPRLEPTTIDGYSVILPNLVEISAGGFWMGSNADEPDASPDEYSSSTNNQRHWVELSAYKIGRYPVTEIEYEMFIRATRHTPPKHWLHSRPPAGKTNHPVVNISWDDAMRYCHWLEQLLKSTGRLPAGYQVRLPTEAEWEKAARWQSDQECAFIFPWGDNWTVDLCNSWESLLYSTSSIGVFYNGTNLYQLYDCAGNVSEWCHSAKLPYPYCVTDGREGYSEELRVGRGGSWNVSRRFVRCAFRTTLPRDFSDPTFGFRLAVGEPLT